MGDQSTFGPFIDSEGSKRGKKRELYIFLCFSVPLRVVLGTGESRNFIFPSLICSETYLMANMGILWKWLNGSKEDRKEQSVEILPGNSIVSAGKILWAF